MVMMIILMKLMIKINQKTQISWLLSKNLLIFGAYYFVKKAHKFPPDLGNARKKTFFFWGGIPLIKALQRTQGRLGTLCHMTTVRDLLRVDSVIAWLLWRCGMRWVKINLAARTCLGYYWLCRELLSKLLNAKRWDRETVRQWWDNGPGAVEQTQELRFDWDKISGDLLLVMERWRINCCVVMVSAIKYTVCTQVHL